MKNKPGCDTLFLLFFLISTTCQSQETILISEVFYDTPYNKEISTFGNGEFVELYNAAEADVDLSDWQLKGVGRDNSYLFPSHTVLQPATACLVAFRHQDSDYKLSDLFPDISEINHYLIVYQKELLLGNGGGVLALYNSKGMLIDSLQYKAANYLSQKSSAIQTESDHTPMSMTRKKAIINVCDYVNIDPKDFTTEKADPLQTNINVVKQAGYTFSYDMSGNRISRTANTVSLSAARSSNEKKNPSQTVGNKQTSVADKLTNHEVIVFPNPTKGQLAIEIHNFQSGQKGELTIQNANGLVMMQKEITSECLELNLQEQLQGVYIMNIYIENETSTWKIYKQ